jgi:allantoin racemase
VKLCCININSAGTSDAFVPVLRQTLDRVRRHDTDITIVSVEPGLQKALDVNSAYFSLLNKVSIVERVIEASRDNFDAAMVVCFLDPAIAEAREMADIPVIGISEASLSLATQLGRKFAIVTLNEPQMIREIERNLLHSGLQSRAIRSPIVPIDIPSEDWLRNGMNDKARIVEAIDAKAKRCVADGADVIIIGCAGLAPIATLEGYTKVDGTEVPVIDCVQAGFKMAEFRAELAQISGWPAVSAGVRARPTERDTRRVRKTFGLE